MASSLVALAIVGSACGDPCLCQASPSAVNVLLTEADSGTVVPLGSFEKLGVELQGSGRTISISDPSRMQAFLPRAEPSGKTVVMFSPTHSGTGTRVNQLLSYGGTEILSAPAQGSHQAWSATVVVTTDPFRAVTTVVAVGQSWVSRWWVGGDGPRTSNASSLAPLGPPVTVRSATQVAGTAEFVVDRSWEQQVLVALAPGTAVVSAPADSPLATNETTEGSEYIVTNVPGWSCSASDGCRQTVLGVPNRPDRDYPIDATPSV
jgi:hypothetical protein